VSELKRSFAEGLLNIYAGLDAQTGRKREYTRKPMTGGLHIWNI